MTSRLVVAWAAFAIALAPGQVFAQVEWACVRYGDPNPLLEKYYVKGDELIDDYSDFAKRSNPGVDPHSYDRALKILEDNQRDILAVTTSNIDAQAGTYTGPLIKPYMSSVFINKVTGEARFVFAGFDGAEKDYLATGRCTRFN